MFLAMALSVSVAGQLHEALSADPGDLPCKIGRATITDQVVTIPITRSGAGSSSSATAYALRHIGGTDRQVITSVDHRA